jgi:hypothetical protein
MAVELGRILGMDQPKEADHIPSRHSRGRQNNDIIYRRGPLYSHVENDTSVGIAYIFCNYPPQQEQKPEDLLLSLLKQSALGRPAVPTEA